VRPPARLDAGAFRVNSQLAGPGTSEPSGTAPNAMVNFCSRPVTGTPASVWKWGTDPTTLLVRQGKMSQASRRPRPAATASRTVRIAGPAHSVRPSGFVCARLTVRGDSLTRHRSLSRAILRLISALSARA